MDVKQPVLTDETKPAKSATGTATVQAIIVAFRSKELARLCDTLKAADIHVLVINNDPLAVLEIDLPQITPGNVGFGTAVNIGFNSIVNSEIEWIVIANDDSLPGIAALDWLGSRLTTLSDDVGVVGFHYEGSDEGHSTGSYRFFFPSVHSIWWTLRHGQRQATQLHPEACRPNAAFFAVRSLAFREAGGFDTDFFLYYEEDDLFYRIQRAGWKFQYTPDAAMIKHGSAVSTSTVPLLTAFENGRSAAIYARKRGWQALIAWLPLWAVFVGVLGCRALVTSKWSLARAQFMSLIGMLTGALFPSWEPLRFSRLSVVGRDERRRLGFIPRSSHGE